MLSFSLVKLSMPLPVQHQKCSSSDEYTLKYPVAMGWKYIVMPVSGFCDDQMALM